MKSPSRCPDDASCRPPWESSAPAPATGGNCGPSAQTAAAPGTPRRPWPRYTRPNGHPPRPNGRPYYSAREPTPPEGTRDRRQGCTDHQTCDENHHEPIGAAWPGSPVPGAPPRKRRTPAPDRRYSPAQLPAFHSPYCRLAGPLGPAAGSPGLRGGSLRPRLLRGLRPVRGHQLTTSLPAAGLEARKGGRPRAVPTFTSRPFDELGAQLLPRQHRHGYAAVLHRGLLAGETNRHRS